MSLLVHSPCKINLVLNILGRRPDGFHELETLMLPIPLFDELSFSEGASGIQVTCSDPSLAVDESNLVFKAARAFYTHTGLAPSIRIHLEKRIPMAAGLGGGSGDAASTLLALNELHGGPVHTAQLQELAAALGSDVPFFLHKGPALAYGRGERIEPLAPFKALEGCGILLVHPGFGISTPWAYQQLARFDSARNGRPGRARDLAQALASGRMETLATGLYNSLEAPALEKYPILKVYQEFLGEQSAVGALMSGSGSATFAIFKNPAQARTAETALRGRFTSLWTAALTL